MILFFSRAYIPYEIFIHSKVFGKTPPSQKNIKKPLQTLFHKNISSSFKIIKKHVKCFVIAGKGRKSFAFNEIS